MEITKKLLKQKFEEYNKLYFNNELPMCRFTYTYMRDVFYLYIHARCVWQIHDQHHSKGQEDRTYLDIKKYRLG